MRDYGSVEGWFSEYDVRDYRKIVEQYSGGNFVEIGCWKGRSLCSIMPLLLENNYQNIFAVDHWMGSQDEVDGPHREARERDIFEIFKGNLEACGFDGKYTAIRMDSATAAEQFEDGYFDVVFIDAEHTYEGFKRDLLAWLPKVRKGGTISGHDGGDPRIVQALNEQFGSNWNPPGPEVQFCMVWSAPV